MNHPVYPAGMRVSMAGQGDAFVKQRRVFDVAFLSAARAVLLMKRPTARCATTRVRRKTETLV